ncbi:MAG: Gfo/Idh/MocA family oxidoreductase [Candidatus Saccharibacteria bacterium]|nr:Gfo/Idh/MocA family oxidoreductase [Pseudorhodobacter sp.]
MCRPCPSCKPCAMPMFFWPAPAIPHHKVVVDVTDGAAETARQRSGSDEASSDWRAVIARPDIDVVDICAPNNVHAEIAIAAAAAGKHIICEKPLARTVEEARAMAAALKKAGVIHMVAFSYRRTPAVALAKKFIDEGRIGRILNFRGTYLQDWSADENGPLSWRFQNKIAGSAAVGDIATHVVDLADYLAGPIAAVNALTRTYMKTRPIQQGGVVKLGASEKSAGAERAEVDADDEVVAMLKFQSGVIASLEATRIAWGRNIFITLEIHAIKGSIMFKYDRRDELQVMFADDPAAARGFRTVYTGPAHPYGQGLWPIPGLGIGYSETKIVECHDFFQAIASGKQPSPNSDDGLACELVVDALLRSGDTRLWENVQK